MRGTTLAKGAAAVLGAIGLVFFIVVRYSATESRFACIGAAQSEPMRVHLKVVQYRAWVKLWSDSAGEVWLEGSDFFIVYYPTVRVVADQVQFRTGDDLTTAKSGTLSLLSGNMRAEVPGRGWVDFTCSRAGDL